jgi:hypothetical protein
MEGTSRASAVRCLSRRELLAALLLFTLLILLTPSALGAHVAELSGRELAAASSNIVVAVIEGREVRWNGKRTLLMTDYTLRVEERLRGEAPERFTLTMPGGTLGDITDEVCAAVELEPGARYLLFLGDLSLNTYSSVGSFIRPNGPAEQSPGLSAAMPWVKGTSSQSAL